MGLPMFGQVIGKFSLNQIPTLNHNFSSYYLFVKKSVFNFDKIKLLLINSIPSALLVINHIEILPLNNHLFNNRDFLKNFDITIVTRNR